MAAFVLMVAAEWSCGVNLAGRTAADPDRAPTLEEMAQATYAGIFDQPIKLVDGRWEGTPIVEGGASRPSVGLIDHFILTGDLDGDGFDDAAALLWESSGGSGTHLYLAAVSRDGRAVTPLDTILIGDRVQVRSGAIANGEVTLDIVRAGPDDAACCPTQRALVTWKLGSDGLSRIADKTVGTLSLVDLGGVEWVLLELGREQPLPQDVEIRLVFREDKVSGNSGCNDYFAGIVTSSPSEFSFNGMGATRMACPEPVMEVERRYLQTLAGASEFRFLAGRLVLICDTEEGPRKLVFAPRDQFIGIRTQPGK